MKKTLLRLSLLSVLCMLFGGGIFAALTKLTGNRAPAEFKDIKIDLTEHSELLTESDVYITVAENGAIGTTANADEAAATIKGKVHGSYGSSNFTASVPVQGCVKITYATHDYGNDIVVTNSNGAQVAKFNTNGPKWMNDHNNVVVAYYRINEPTTLNFSKANYNPYFAVEAIDPTDIPAEVTNYNITFAAGEGTGVAPTALEIAAGSKFNTPKNYTLYAEGKTLTGWSDGTKTYAIGEEISPEADMTLTAVFTANEVSLADRAEPVTLNIPLDGYNDNPKYNYQSGAGMIVTQATIGDKTIDVKIDTNGKFAHNGSGWHQVNAGTKVTVPSCKGASFAVKTYQDSNALKFGDTAATASEDPATYTATSEDATLIIEQTAQGYWNNLTITLPVVEQGGGGGSEPGEGDYSDTDFNITWSMANGSESVGVATPSEAFMQKQWSVGSMLTIDATATGTYFSKTFTRFTRVGSDKLENNRTKLDDSFVEFSYKPFAGVTATPTTLDFDITKIGTGDPNIWVEFIQGTTVTSVGENVVIRKNSEATPSEHLTYDLTALSAIVASGDDAKLRIYIGKLANNKQVGIANVKITGKVNGTVENYTTVYDIPAKLAANIEGKTGTVAPSTADEKSNAYDLQVDATNGKLGVNNADWAQITEGTLLTVKGVPQGATVTFALYNTTALTIKGTAYTNGQTYTATKDENLKMKCTTGGYIKSITVEGTAFVDVLDGDGYTNTWYFGKTNGAPEFKLEKSPEFTYTVEGRPLVINTSTGKLNNVGRDDNEWAQCNDGTKFKVPVYAGSKLSWRKYNGGDQAGFTVNGVLYNDYYVATEEGVVELVAKGVGYLSSIKIEPEELYDVTGSITGGSVDGARMLFTGSNGQVYSATITSGAFALKVPADQFTLDLSDDVPYVVSTPAAVTVSDACDVGTITIEAAQPQTVTGIITNAPGEAFTLTFTGASHNKQVECAANATSFETTLDPDTYTISSSVGALSPLSKASFKILKEAFNHNIYFPEAAVPAATQQNITVDNTATVAANVYNTVTDALAAAKAGNISNPIITLTSGQTYREQVIVDMPNVTLKTSGEEKATITFYYGIGYAYYSLDENGYYSKDRANTRNSILMIDPARWGCTVRVTNKGNNFKAENIIFENSFNQYYTEEEILDGVRPNGAQSIKYDRTLKEGETGYYAADTKQVTERAAAIAIENNPTGIQLYNCTFVGSQDTFYSSGKIYVKNCNLIGNTDYMFGGGFVVFDNCDLTIGGYSDKETSAYMTAYKDGENLDANKCYIFRDCTVKKSDRQYVLANLGRDWGGKAASVYYFNLMNEIGDKLKYSWTDMGGGVKDAKADLHIYDFSPSVNANYATTGTNGANINGLVSDEKALALYAGVVTKLGFTPERIYEDKLLLDESSDYNICRIAASNAVERTVTLTKEIKAGDWNAIVLPFDLTADQITAAFGEGTKVATLTSADASTLNFTTTTDGISAGQSYLINAGEDFVTKDIAGVTINNTITATQVVDDWTINNLYLLASDKAGNYFFNENQVQKIADSDTSVLAFGSYFTNANAANEVIFKIDGEATGIHAVKAAIERGEKVIFNLAGQRVDAAYKGLVIRDGVKIMQK